MNPAEVAIVTMESIIKGLKDGTLEYEDCELIAHQVETTPDGAEAKEFTQTGREILRIQYLRADSPTFQVVFSKVILDA